VTLTKTVKSLEDCPDAVDVIVLTITSPPVVTPLGDIEVCSGDIVNVDFTSSAGGGEVFTWTNSNPSVGLPANGTGNLSFTSANAPTNPAPATITVSANKDGCPTADGGQDFTITIVDTPVISLGSDNIEETSFDVAWSEIAGATGYNVSISSEDDGINWEETTNAISYSYSGLIGNHVYEVTVEALGAECPPKPVSITVLTIPPVVAFSSIYVNPIGEGSYEVSWNLTTDHTERIISSEVMVLEDYIEEPPFINDKGISPATTIHQITVTDVLKEYVLYIRQRNDTGPSKNSQPYFIDIGRHLNTVESKLFDEIGEVVSHSKAYFDLSGNSLQSQTKNFTKNTILATIPIYDQYHRAIGNTLPAPIGLQEIGYREGILRNEDSEAYDFDDIKEAKPTGTQQNTVGRYYSEENIIEPNTPTTVYPYSITEYYEDGTGEVKSVIGPGEVYRIDGHNAYSGTFPVGSTLNDYMTLRQLIIKESNDVDMTYNAIQNVGIDANGIMGMSIVDKNGNTIMSGVQAEEDATSVKTITNNLSSTSTNRSLYLYLQEGQETVTWSGTGAFKVYDLLNETELEFDFYDTNLPILPAGFYKITANASAHTVSANYKHVIDHISYNFYDDAGRLVASIAPEGVKQMMDAIAENPNYLDVIGPNDQLPFTFMTTYKYNHQGWLLSMTEPDAGTTKYMYRRDGSIRFSQNAEQKRIEDKGNQLGTDINSIYSYTNYDDLGRPIESGEYRLLDYQQPSPPPGGSTPQIYTYEGDDLDDILEDTGNETLDFSNHVDSWVRTFYDIPASNFNALTGLDALYQQDFVMGAVSWTENANIKTWYSYDEMGRVTWMAQKPDGLDLSFVVSYNYDFLGNVNDVSYRSYLDGVKTDEFYHYYFYDADKRLSETFTSQTYYSDEPSLRADATLQAKYEYYLHGPLKRIELGGNLQGIDFTYNIQGWLTAINDPSNAKDQSGFSDDAFSMILEYYETNMTYISSPPTGSLSPQEQHGLLLGNDIPQMASLFMQFSPVISTDVFTDNDTQNTIDLGKYSAEQKHYKELMENYAMSINNKTDNK
jgi:hypothetical protein